MGMVNTQGQVNTSTDSSQNPQSLNPISSQRGNVPIILGMVLLLLIIGGAAYYLGTQRNKEIPLNQQSVNQTQVIPTIAPKDQVVGAYIKYQHKMFHLGYPVFEVEVPSAWSAYVTYGKLIYRDPATIYLGEAQNKSNGSLNDMISSVEIRIAKNKQLSDVDPKQWSQDDQLALFGGTPLSNDWINVTVNSLNAKKISVPTIGSPKEIVYVTKDGVIFTISNEGENQATFDRILSSFKIIDLKYL